MKRALLISCAIAALPSITTASVGIRPTPIQPTVYAWMEPIAPATRLVQGEAASCFVKLDARRPVLTVRIEQPMGEQDVRATPLPGCGDPDWVLYPGGWTSAAPEGFFHEVGLASESGFAGIGQIITQTGRAPVANYADILGSFTVCLNLAGEHNPGLDFVEVFGLGDVRQPVRIINVPFFVWPSTMNFTAASVPEPGIALLVIGGVLAARRRRE